MNSLETQKTVEKLQSVLNAKAKTEPKFRFYSLWDKVYRKDVLMEAYRACRQNAGAPGIDGETFEKIKEQGLENWIGNLQKELQNGTYRFSPLLRVWIPKTNGELRPLGIATIKDRVVQGALCLVLGPIFEADLDEGQYGFRPDRDAKMALKAIQTQINEGKTEVVDVDLKSYFDTIPHKALLKCIARRVVDARVLRIVKMCITVPVVEVKNGKQVRTTEAKDKHRGVPQGSPLSPLLSNVYLRRFLKAWSEFNLGEVLKSKIVAYADDFVICVAPGNGVAALQNMTSIINALGLIINVEKTRLVDAIKEDFDFLGYTFGRFYGFRGKQYRWHKPSLKAEKKLRQKIRSETCSNTTWRSMSKEASILNKIVCGWANYFIEGAALESFRRIQNYLNLKVTRWLRKKHACNTNGFNAFPERYLHESMGLIKLPNTVFKLLKAKAKFYK